MSIKTKAEYHKAVCSSKRGYTTKRLAKAAAKAFIGVKGAKKSYPYECPVCGSWHLTKIKQNKGESPND